MFKMSISSFITWHHTTDSLLDGDTAVQLPAMTALSGTAHGLTVVITHKHKSIGDISFTTDKIRIRNAYLPQLINLS